MSGRWAVLLLGIVGGRALADPLEISIAPVHESFTAYGERIFRWQNALMDELLEAENAEPPPSTFDSLQLAKAEARIVGNCRALNEAASQSASGRRPSVQLRMQVAASLRGCDAAARTVKQFLLARARGARVALP